MTGSLRKTPRLLPNESLRPCHPASHGVLCARTSEARGRLFGGAQGRLLPEGTRGSLREYLLLLLMLLTLSGRNGSKKTPSMFCEINLGRFCI